jgi:hypothetical protein
MTVLSGAVEDGKLVVFEGVVEGVGVGVGVWGVGVMGGKRGRGEEGGEGVVEGEDGLFVDMASLEGVGCGLGNGGRGTRGRGTSEE